MSEERATDDELEAMAAQAKYDTRMLEKIPALVKEVRRLRAENERYRRELVFPVEGER